MSKRLETKMVILKVLMSRKMTISELSEKMGLSRATVAQHLADMKEAGAVEQVPNVYFKKHLYYRAVHFGDKETLVEAKTRWKKGNAFFEDKKYEKALKEFSAAISKDQRYADAHFNRALTYVMLKDFDSAAKDLEVVMRLTPKSHDAAVLMGEIEEKRGNPEKAKHWYEKALEFYPDYGEAKSRLKRIASIQSQGQ